MDSSIITSKYAKSRRARFSPEASEIPNRIPKLRTNLYAIRESVSIEYLGYLDQLSTIVVTYPSSPLTTSDINR